MFKVNLIRLCLLFLIFQHLLVGCTLFEKEFILPLPTATEADQVSAVGFMAHWKKVIGATSYEIDVALDKEFTIFVPNYQDKEVEGLTLSIEGLEANETYYYRVRANISNQTSKSSNIIEVTTEGLDIPITYPATEVTSTSFRVHWKTMPVVTTYELDVALDEAFNQLLDNYKEVEVAAEDTSFLVSNVTVNKQYFYRVRVKQSESFSEYSNVQSVFTSTLPAPKTLPASNIELTSFTANWEALSEAKSFEVDIATDALFQQMLTGYDKFNTQSNSLVVPNLNANTEYFYRVRAINDEATSNHSEIVTVKTQNLTAPMAIAATNIQSGGFQANWNPVVNAASYLLDVALDQGFTKILPGYNGFPVINNFAEIPSLDASTTYFYRVRAQGLGAISDNSNIIQVTTGLLPAPVATAPTNQKVFEFTANWQVQDGISLYVLDIATDANFTQFLTGYQSREVAGNAYTITGLDFRQTYYYRLRSKRLSKLSDYSNVIQVNACISTSCKMDSLKIFTGTTLSTSRTQRFLYDSQNRLTDLISDVSAFSKTYHRVTYNGDNTIQKVVTTAVSWFTRTTEYIYAYNGNQLASITKTDGSGNFDEAWEFDYNASGQRISWRIYSDQAKSTVTAQFDYTYDAQGNVTQVTDRSGAVARRYKYDEKLSPLTLFNPDLCFFVATNRDSWAGGGLYRGFLPVNNIISEEVISFSSSTEVFIFLYNSKDVALEQQGFYSAQYILKGCDF
ncbi:hypothetical protein BKI52_13845 [marine bacterium AO1-C]|nr:hypothetical protein BKI52_13845 [marine bacterium AO1-C]